MERAAEESQVRFNSRAAEERRERHLPATEHQRISSRFESEEEGKECSFASASKGLGRFGSIP